MTAVDPAVRAVGLIDSAVDGISTEAPGLTERHILTAAANAAATLALAEAVRSSGSPDRPPLAQRRQLERLHAGIRAIRTEVAPLTTVAAAWIDTRLDQLLVADPTHGDGRITVAGVPAEHRAGGTAQQRGCTCVLHRDTEEDHRG